MRYPSLDAIKSIRKKGSTMSFRDNLQHLRATRNMTQEQLAMMVGVSRQSVTKWEAERAYPEMDKLLKLCQIFDCTLDDLVQGDLTARAPEPELAIPAAALAEDVIGYDEHFHSYAWHIAVGVGLCILGIAVSSTLDEWLGDGPTALGFFGFVGMGLVMIIPAAMEHSAFCKAHPYVADFYSDEDRIPENRRYGIRLTGGICCILASLVFGAFADQAHIMGPLMELFFVGVAVGVTIIVYASILHNRLDVESYNIDALEELSEEDISAIVGPERAPLVLEKVRRSKRKGAACGIIMLLATAVALPLMFWATSNGNTFWTQYFWIAWMVGGFLCAIACIVIDQQK